jgi:DNA-binding winged helix-turn-helix (wHTH) protein
MDACGSADILLFDRFRFDRRRGGCLFRLDAAGGAEPVPLCGRKLALLGLLLERHGRLVDKDEIMKTVWRGRIVEEANLNVQIAKLRHLLDENREQGSCIQTITGHGYRFVAPVTPAPGTLIPATADDAALLRPQVVIIVLPVAGLGGDRTQQYLADNVGGDLTIDLSRIPNIFVSLLETGAAHQNPVEVQRLRNPERAECAADEFVQVQRMSPAAGWPRITRLKAAG